MNLKAHVAEVAREMVIVVLHRFDPRSEIEIPAEAHSLDPERNDHVSRIRVDYVSVGH